MEGLINQLEGEGGGLWRGGGWGMDGMVWDGLVELGDAGLVFGYIRVID